MSEAPCVLLVDDEPDILESLAMVLEGHLPDVGVMTASDGKEALRILEQQRVDVLITDFKMPGMSGLDLLAEAARIAPKVPRMMMTAFPDLDLAMSALNRFGVDGFLVKPLDPEDVVQKVRASLDSRREVSELGEQMARAFDARRRIVQEDGDQAAAESSH